MILNTLETTFPLAIDGSSYSPTLADLVARFPAGVDSNRVVWVKDEKRFYYLIDGGDGSNIGDWQALEGVGINVPAWNSLTIYAIGDLARVGGVLYMATTISTNLAPASNPSNWVRVGAGSSTGGVQTFTAQTILTIPHGMTADIIVCVYDSSGKMILSGVTVDAVNINVEFSEATTGKVVWR